MLFLGQKTFAMRNRMRNYFQERYMFSGYFLFYLQYSRFNTECKGTALTEHIYSNEDEFGSFFHKFSIETCTSYFLPGTYMDITLVIY